LKLKLHDYDDSKKKFFLLRMNPHVLLPVKKKISAIYLYTTKSSKLVAEDKGWSFNSIKYIHTR
jgi:hypothetical protein